MRRQAQRTLRDIGSSGRTYRPYMYNAGGEVECDVVRGVKIISLNMYRTAVIAGATPMCRGTISIYVSIHAVIILPCGVLCSHLYCCQPSLL